jgi:hypothetical protein
VTYALHTDPAESTVDEVTTALAVMSPEDVEKIKAQEAEGKARKGILDWAPTAGTVKADEDGYSRVLVEDAYQPGEPIEPAEDTQE